MAKKKKLPYSQRPNVVLKQRFVPGSNGTAWTQVDGKKKASKNACRGKVNYE